MSAIRFDIERIAVTLSGCSEADARRVADVLEAELTARLCDWRPAIAGAEDQSVGSVDLGSVDVASPIDAATIAGLIADRLAHWIDSAATGGEPH